MGNKDKAKKKKKDAKEVTEVMLDHIFMDRKGEALRERTVDVEEVNRVVQMRARGIDWRSIGEAMADKEVDVEEIPELTLAMVCAVELDRDEQDDRGKSKLTQEQKVRRSHLGTRILNAGDAMRMTNADKTMIMELITKYRSNRITTQALAIIDPAAYDGIVKGIDDVADADPEKEEPGAPAEENPGAEAKPAAAGDPPPKT